MRSYALGIALLTPHPIPDMGIVLYLDVGLGYYDVNRADLEGQSRYGSYPANPKSDGASGTRGS